MQKKIRTLETKSNKRLPQDFTSRLEDFASTYQAESRGFINVRVSELQADPEIAALATRGHFDAVISSDSDFAMLIGPSAGGDLTIRNPQLRYQDTTIGTMQVVTGQSKVADHVHSALQSKLTVPIFLDDPDGPLNMKYQHRPRYPLFDKVTDHLLRALIAVALGCEAWPGGISNFGPKTAAEELEKLAGRPSLSDSERCDAFAAALAKNSSCTVKDKEAILCFAQSLLYEKFSLHMRQYSVVVILLN
jgi:hypothetical protein